MLKYKNSYSNKKAAGSTRQGNNRRPLEKKVRNGASSGNYIPFFLLLKNT
jgi:hypothetical protein